MCNGGPYSNSIALTSSRYTYRQLIARASTAADSIHVTGRMTRVKSGVTATEGSPPQHRVDIGRLVDRIEALADIGPIDGGGNSRLALTDRDREGRDLVVTWMRDLGLSISVDGIGNVVGVWQAGEGPPVLIGSHIDTVATGGRFDGNLGVLAGLEVIEALQQAGARPSRPIGVGFFTNEEGARFAPDMMGSLVYAGGLAIEQALDTIAIDGARLADELDRIGYAGPTPSPGPVPYAFVELHIEQGPVLEQVGVQIGAVTGVQGISWTEFTFTGRSSHAGTTPMSMRRDPSVPAARLLLEARLLAERLGGPQVATVGRFEPYPNLVNVVPRSVRLTLDARNSDEAVLQHVEHELFAFAEAAAIEEGCILERRSLARFQPVQFDDRVIDLVAATARQLGLSVQRMPSGAGHDAQMFARICPTAMVFVPSVDGLSHNPAEFTAVADLENGANVLINVVWTLATAGLNAKEPR
jgi:beta-ureidopropionase / N-carbamoyl-L-amino-acid hydrolase